MIIITNNIRLENPVCSPLNLCFIARLRCFFLYVHFLLFFFKSLLKWVVGLGSRLQATASHQCVLKHCNNVGFSG